MHLATAAAGAAVLVIASASSPSTPSGLTGRVLLDPATPVCRLGTPCTRPLPSFGLAFSRRGNVVARPRTDSRGRYRVALAAGVYAVRPAGAHSVGRGLEPARVRVLPGRVRRVDFRYDSGIR